MSGSREYNALAALRRCQVIVVAYAVLNAFDYQYVDAFSIDYSFRRYRVTTTSVKNVNIAMTPMHMRGKRKSRCETLLREQPVAQIRSDFSNVTIDSDHEGYTFQSKSTLQNDRLSKNCPRTQSGSLSSIKDVTTELYNPISDLQMMMLKSQISRYIVSSPILPTGDTNRHLDKSKTFTILWRNLINDTPELTGYPISFLSEQMKAIMRFIDLKSNATTALTSTELALKNISKDAEIDWDIISPYIDAYTFEVGGGLTGLVYGVNGVADGTLICTTSVGDVQATIARNYIQTGDGCIYELGRPAFSKDSVAQAVETTQSYSLSGASKEWFQNGKETAAQIAENTRIIVDGKTSDDNVIDSDLLHLAGWTTLVLGGAMAMETLSHHLTVNIFGFEVIEFILKRYIYCKSRILQHATKNQPMAVVDFHKKSK